jgi:alkaline phosphatase D
LRRAAFVLLLAAAVGGGGAAHGADGFLIAAGDVTAASAVVWFRAPTPGPAAVEVRTAAGDVVARREITATRGDDLTARVAIADLHPGTRYRYRVTQAGAGEDGEFVTAPAADVASPVSFLWSGDLGSAGFCRRADGGYPIFEPMARARADFFLFVGDTVYADHRCRGEGMAPGGDFVATTLAGYRAKHRYNRADPGARAFFRTTSVYAIWDDHEVRNDFAGPTEPLMPLGRRAFLEYWPIAADAGDPGRLYRKFRWGKLLEVFILDTRQYRSPNTELDGPGKTMLGGAQRRWLVDGVTASTAVWKVVVSSVPFSVPTGRAEQRDGWSSASVWGLGAENATGFGTERDAILRALRDRGVRNLVILAADVHHAELIRHHPTPEFSFHEFIAGPLSAAPGRPRALDAALNGRSLFARGGIHNFGHVSIEPAHLTVRIVDAGGTTLFTHTTGPE